MALPERPAGRLGREGAVDDCHRWRSAIVARGISPTEGVALARPAVTRSRSAPDRATIRSSCSTRASKFSIAASRCSSACLSSRIASCSGSGAERARACAAVPPNTSMATIRPPSRLKARIRTFGNTRSSILAGHLAIVGPGVHHQRSQVIGYAGRIDPARPAECDGHLFSVLRNLVADRLWPFERDPFEFSVLPGSHFDPGCRVLPYCRLQQRKLLGNPGWW